MPISSSKDIEDVRSYVESQAHESVVHLEHAASELVGSTRYEIWDVHCETSRWWVVTNPMNLYDQRDFRSRDVVLTFHIGLMARMAHLQARQVPVTRSSEALLAGSWRRWEQAFDTYEHGDEAETFQAVGVQLRESLISFIDETCSNELVVAGSTRPKGSDFTGWTDLLANALAAGDSAANLRSYLKRVATETWQYVNWLTHAKNAIRMDAEIGLKAVEHLLGSFTAARIRLAVPRAKRCAECGSYAVHWGECRRCGWADPSYEPPVVEPISDEEWERRLAEPCTTSSDISTFLSPRDLP